MGEYTALDGDRCRALADALGDTPETVISAHLLRRGRARAWLDGAPEYFRAAVVQAVDLPGEPMGFGTDPEALWGLLRDIEGWFCCEVVPAIAPAVGVIFAREVGQPVRTLEDLYFTLTETPPLRADARVRLLAPADLPLLESAPAELRGPGWGGPGPLLAEGIAAGAVVDGRLVALAHTSAQSARHADIGVYTLAEWRGRGFATSAAALVAGRVLDSGRVPVWSTGATNAASQAVARALGFREVSRRVYVIVDARRG